MRKETSPDAGAKWSILDPAEAIGPVAVVKRDLKKALPRRFYNEAKVAEPEGAFVLVLDGRHAKTPGGNPMALPSLAAAEAIAEEWLAQGEFIDPAAMPLTRVVSSAIDAAAHRRDAMVDAIVKYAGADLVCYRAAEPEALAQAQAAAWDPILVFAHEKLGAHFICTEGVVFAEQTEPALTAVKVAIAHIANSGPAAPFALAALHVMTTLTGSVLLALSVAHGALTPTEAWIAAHVDEDFAMRAWGEDAEALRRRARQWREMEAAARLFQAVESAGA
ncbi:MAG: ATP12 family chaperone protein [Methylocella sp.]